MPTAIDELLKLVNDYDALLLTERKAPGKWVANYNKTRIYIEWIPMDLSVPYLVSKKYWFVTYMYNNWYMIRPRIVEQWKIERRHNETWESKYIIDYTDLENVHAQIALSNTPINELIYLLWLHW